MIKQVKKVEREVKKISCKFNLLDSVYKNHLSDRNKRASDQPQEIIVPSESDHSIEIILTQNEIPKPTEPIFDQNYLYQEARRLLSRFYYHIKTTMTENNKNQNEAIKLIREKLQGDNDPYQKLINGFITIYFNSNKKCNACKRLIDEPSQLDHIQSAHAPLQIYICVNCKIPFQKKEELEKHIFQTHPQSKLLFKEKQKPQKNNVIVQKQSKPTQQQSTLVHNLKNIKNTINNYKIPSQPIVSRVFIQSDSPPEEQNQSIFNQIYLPKTDQAVQTQFETICEELPKQLKKKQKIIVKVLKTFKEPNNMQIISEQNQNE